MCDTYTTKLQQNDLKHGIIHIQGTINDYEVEKLRLEVNEIQRVKPKIRRITIFMVSPGGGVYEAFGMYDIIKNVSKAEIETEIIVEGLAASAAAMIVLQAANKRKGSESSRFLLHEIRRWTWEVEKTSEVKDTVKELEKLELRVFEILAGRCKKTVNEIRKAIDRRESWMSAQEALEFGLIDEVL